MHVLFPITGISCPASSWLPRLSNLKHFFWDEYPADSSICWYLRKGQHKLTRYSKRGLWASVAPLSAPFRV